MAENRPENHKPHPKLAAASRSKKEVAFKKMSSDKAAAERRAVEAEARLAKAESALQAAQQSLYRLECRAKDEHGRSKRLFLLCVPMVWLCVPTR